MSKVKKSQFKYNKETMIAAVDIGKSKNTVCFRDSNGNDSPPHDFVNMRYGFENFLKIARWYKIKYNAKHIVVGFESTGIYGIPFAHFLDNHKIKTYLVNPVHTKRAKEFRDNSPNKTDQKDPRVIADLMQLGCTLSMIIPKGTSADLRQLVNARERVTSRINMLHNQMHDLVFQIFPEFTYHFKNLLGKTSLYLLEHYTSPEAYLDFSTEELGILLSRISRGRFSTEKAKALLEACHCHGGITGSRDYMIYEIRELVNKINTDKNLIKKLDNTIEEILALVPTSRLYLSIKGIGPVTVATIIGETAGMNGFTHAGELEKLAGLNLYEVSSGRHKGEKHISKRGRSLLRKALYFAALNTVKKNGAFHDKYQSYLDRGMPKNKALIAISRKMVRILFAIARDKKEFNPDYERLQISKKAA